jgi:hypothetical protein
MYEKSESPQESASTNLTPGDNAPFTPELMARFCEVLAETGRVTAACCAVGKHRDTIYAHHRTNALFAMALDSARGEARHRLADMLLEDSLEGSVDYFYRGGELVGERRYRDNRLALAMLRRRDKAAGEQPVPLEARSGFNAKLALKALRTGSEEDLCAALATLDSDTSDSPPFDEEIDEDVSDSNFGSDRVWEEEEGVWWTNFPPPEHFAGREDGHWSDEDYMRECSPEECDLLNTAREFELSDERAEEEAERDAWFAELKAELEQVHGTSAAEDDESDDLLTVTQGDPLLYESNAALTLIPRSSRDPTSPRQDEAPAEPPSPRPVEPAQWTSRRPGRGPTAH